MKDKFLAVGPLAGALVVQVVSSLVTTPKSVAAGHISAMGFAITDLILALYACLVWRNRL